MPDCCSAGATGDRGQGVDHVQAPMGGFLSNTFTGAKLREHLNDLCTNTLVICGCNFPNCPRVTIYEASERDFRVVLVKDATSNVYERGLHELDKIGVELMTSDDCIAALK